jgi:hypothetical protein
MDKGSGDYCNLFGGEGKMGVIVGIINTLLNLILISTIGIIVGFFIFSKPERIIEIQIKFYARINWRMEPISMPKEIRNTKVMGIFLVFVSVVAVIYSCLR